jgi:PilZ domain-containing protein
MQPRVRPRIEVNYPVTFTGDSLSGHGTLMNLTVAGAEISSDVNFPIDSHVALRVQTSGARPAIVITLAIVRWKREDRFGLEFIRFDGQSKQQLEDMLK